MEEENLSKEFLPLLNQLALVEQKVVTSSFLLRHTPLDVFQIQRHFLDLNSNAVANYYLLGPLNSEPGKKQCTIVRGDELTNAKQQLAKVDICNIFSVQTNHVEMSLKDVFKANWLEQNIPVMCKGVLKDSQASTAQPKCGNFKTSPISLSSSKGADDGEGVGVIEKGDREAGENAETTKKPPTRKITHNRRPILFTPITKEEEQKQGSSDTCNSQSVMKGNPSKGRERVENDSINSIIHPPVKRPIAQPVKREAKMAKTKATDNGGNKQTTIFNFFKK